MVTVLQYVKTKEKLQADDGVLREIAQDANGNMRKALLVFEALKMQKYAHPFSLFLPSLLPHFLLFSLLNLSQHPIIFDYDTDCDCLNYDLVGYSTAQ